MSTVVEDLSVGQLWRISVTREVGGEAYVWAASEKEAESAASELADDIVAGEWSEDHIDVSPAKDYKPRRHDQIWVGGDVGDWVQGDEWSPPGPEERARVAERERAKPTPGQRDIFGGEVT